MSAVIEQRNQDATVYIGNLDERMNEELLWEMMLQVGPVVNVHMPKDKVTGKHVGYGFVEFRTEEDADYAMKVMNMVKVFGKPIKVNKASQDKKANDVGANIFIGNLDPEVDEKQLYDTFVAFGPILQTPHIMRDPDTGVSKGYGFVSYDSFEASDLAIDVMNGQYLANRPIVCQYAFKKDTPGERHGSQAERILAASLPKAARPNTMFSAGDGMQPLAAAMYNPLGMQFMSGMPVMPPPMNLPMYLTPQAQIPSVPPMPPPPFMGSVPQPPPPPAQVALPPPPPRFAAPPPPPSN